MRFLQGVLVSLFVLLLCGHAPAGEASVTDGDGLRIGDERIRLWGIDAPELDQQCRRNRTVYACGTEARDALERLVDAGAPSCERLYEDPYGRTVARCSVAGVDLGAEMVRLGLAVDFRRYSKGAYADEEAQARAARRGLWAGEFEVPAQWRRTH
jgi:endonuclease YncB( thermonuclease family)